MILDVSMTTKQLYIMSVVTRGNPDGSFVDQAQLMERLPYIVTERALQFSVRYLVQKGLLSKSGLEKRRGRNRLLLVATTEGYSATRRLLPLSANIMG